MVPAAALLALALAAGPQPPARVYAWKDAKGHVHMTDAPPPPGAEVVSVSTRPANGSRVVAPAGPPPAELPADLPSDQRPLWESRERRIADVREHKDAAGIASLAHELVGAELGRDGGWGTALLPLLSMGLLGLLGWWAALALRRRLRAPVMVLALLAGLTLGQWVLMRFVHRPRLAAIRANMKVLALDAGGHALPDRARTELELGVSDLEYAATLPAPPWRFPQAARELEGTVVRALSD